MKLGTVISRIALLFAPVTFFFVGAINLIPVVGVMSAEVLGQMYGIDVHSSDVILLLRHRAVLFLIVGALLIISTFKPSLRMIAGTAGLVSMLSFVLIAWLNPVESPEISRVVTIDIVASIALALAMAVQWLVRDELRAG